MVLQKENRAPFDRNAANDDDRTYPLRKQIALRKLSAVLERAQIQVELEAHPDNIVLDAGRGLASVPFTEDHGDAASDTSELITTDALADRGRTNYRAGYGQAVHDLAPHVSQLEDSLGWYVQHVRQLGRCPSSPRAQHTTVLGLAQR